MSYNYGKVQVERVIEKLRSVTCDECGVEAELWPADHDFSQPKGFLGIGLTGGYSMYFDPIGIEAEVVLCRGCADRLVSAFPSIKKAIESAD